MQGTTSTSDKLLAVFGLFTPEAPEWTVEAAAERLGLGMSTAYRFFRSLSDAGLISTFSAGRYVLGPAIVQLDRQIRLQDPLMRVAQPVMRRVAEELEIPGVMLLCRLFRRQVMCIHQEAFDRPPSTVSYERGRPMPLHRGAVSKIILAHMPARQVRALYEAHAADMEAAGYGPDWDAVKASLRRLRATRVCMSFGELDPGMTGFGTALRNPAGAVDASLGFVLPDELLSPRREAALKQALDAAAREIDAGLAQASNGASDGASGRVDGVRDDVVGAAPTPPRTARPRRRRTAPASGRRASGSAARA